MSAETAKQFAQIVLSSKAAQRELQKVMNDLASSVVEIGKREGCEITVQDVGQFLLTTFFPDGSTPDSPVYERRQWLPIMQEMLTQLRVSNPDHQMFQTMSFEGLNDESGELQELLKAARSQQESKSQATPVPAVPTAPAVEAFEPDESYFDDSSNSVDKELAAAQQRIAEMEGALEAKTDKPFWKVW